jgi:hypothetical protein
MEKIKITSKTARAPHISRVSCEKSTLHIPTDLKTMYIFGIDGNVICLLI